MGSRNTPIEQLDGYLSSAREAATQLNQFIAPIVEASKESFRYANPKLAAREAGQPARLDWPLTHDSRLKLRLKESLIPPNLFHDYDDRESFSYRSLPDYAPRPLYWHEIMRDRIGLAYSELGRNIYSRPDISITTREEAMLWFIGDLVTWAGAMSIRGYDLLTVADLNARSEWSKIPDTVGLYVFADVPKTRNFYSWRTEQHKKTEGLPYREIWASERLVVGLSNEQQDLKAAVEANNNNY